MKRLIVVLCFLIGLFNQLTAAEVNIAVKIKNTPVAIPEANIDIQEKSYETDKNGQLKVELAPGQYTINVQAVGYEDNTISIDVKNDVLDIVIELEVKIVVKATTQTVTSEKVSIGYQRVDGKSIKRLTEATLIPDVMNSLKLLPGVSSDGTTSSTIYIRGGDRDEIIALIDNIPIRTPYYFGGANSIFNPKTIEAVEFYPGGYGAEFGQALSGIVDVESLDGNNDYFYGSLDGSLLELNSFFNIPVVSEKSNLTVAFRRTHYDVALEIAEILGLWEESSSTLPSYYSLETKYVHKLNGNHSLELSYRDFISQMDFTFEDEETDETFSFNIFNDLNILSTQLESQLSKKFFNRFLIARSASDGKYVIDTTNFGFTNNYNQPQTFIRNDTTWTPIDKHQIDFGGFLYNYIEDSTGQYTFVYTDDWIEDAEEVTVNISLDSLIRLGGVYLKDTYQVTPRFTIEYGGRLSLFKVESYSIRSYLQPRLTLLYNINDKTTFKTYFGTYRQIGQEANSKMQADGSLQTLLPDLNMQQSIQYGAGLEHYLRKDILFKTEYYRKDYTDLFINEAVEPETIFTNSGKGYSRGIEVMLQQLEGGKQHGWLTYTLSDTKKYNEDGWYRPEYDLRHMGTIFYERKLNKNRSLIVSSQVRTGKRYTPLVQAADGTYSEGALFSKRLNSYIMVDIWYQHPIDVVTLSGVFRFGFTNALNRKNELSYQFNSQTNEPEIAYDFPQFRFFIVGFELFF